MFLKGLNGKVSYKCLTLQIRDVEKKSMNSFKRKCVFSCLFIAFYCAVGAVSAQDASEKTSQRQSNTAEGFTLEQLKSLAGKKGFKPYDGNPVLSPGKKGAWDAGALGSMTVVKVNGVYHLYYEAWGIPSAEAKGWMAWFSTLQIGHATSKDGIHWKKDAANPVIAKDKNTWEVTGTWDPFVIYEEGRFKMWYGGGHHPCDWAYAVSKDGTHFIKQGRISYLGAVEDDHVIHDTENNLYHMYYIDREIKRWGGLLRATSHNETEFDFGAAQGLKISGEQYPARYKFTHVFVDNGILYMLYGRPSRKADEGTIRLATSSDGVHWRSVNKNLLVGIDGEIIKADKNLYLIYYGPQGYYDKKNCDIRVALYKGELKHLVAENAPTTPD
jgi:hypothetical protein